MDRIYVMELVRSFQCGYLTRREFLTRAAAATGSMAAANTLLAACSAPTSAPPATVVDQTPPPATSAGAPAAATNGTSGASATAPGTTEAGSGPGMVSYPGPGGQTLTGFLATPPGATGALPGIILIQEWWGLNDHIKDVAQRLANEGYVVLAPDLYHGVVATEPDEARKQVMALDMANAVREIQSAISTLQSREDVRGPKVGMVGFCMGGGLVLQTTIADPSVGAAVAFYGSPLAPDQAAAAKAPILGLYGEQDQGIPAANVQAMGQALTAAGIPNEMHIYPGAGHAFFNDTRDSYNPDAAADAWSRTLAWFQQYL